MLKKKAQPKAVHPYNQVAKKGNYGQFEQFESNIIKHSSKLEFSILTTPLPC